MVTIPSPVLSVLRAGTAEGSVFRLPGEQLDRALYLSVNEVLARLGGKWNRKVKGHVFDDVEPAPLIDLVLTTAEMPPKNPTAFFATPVDVAERLLTDPALPSLPAGAKRILEPSAGRGALLDALSGTGARVECCEILPRFRDLLTEREANLIPEPNFLAYRPGPVYDGVVMNPPFAVEGDALAYVTHIEHALDCLAPGGVLLSVAPGGFASRQDRRVRELRERVEASGAWVKVEGEAFKASDTGVRTVLLGIKVAA
jgi:SAM-dependent methyltransferase